MQNLRSQIRHVFKEANKLANNIANEAIDAVEEQQYKEFRQLSSTSRKIINMDKYGIPYIRIRIRPIYNS